MKNRRILSGLLSLLLVLSLLPVSAFAAGATVYAIPTPEFSADEDWMPELIPSLDDAAHCTVESIVYDTPGPVEPYTWMQATVTYAAQDGYTFSDDLRARFTGHCAAEVVRSTGTEAVVTYYAWAGMEDASATQEMKAYYRAHGDEAANGRTVVATGKKFDPIAQQHPGITGFCTARMYKYPIVLRSAGFSDLPETVEIYDLHAEQLRRLLADRADPIGIVRGFPFVLAHFTFQPRHRGPR